MRIPDTDHRWRRHGAVVFLAMLACPVGAHSFAAPYTLPVPFWMYAYGATAALALSFIVAGLFTTVPHTVAAGGAGRTAACAPTLLPAAVVGTLRAAAVAPLALTLVCGFVGSASPYLNLNMTMFWIVFVLGFTYLTAFVGDLFAFCNPWHVLCGWLARHCPGGMGGRLRWPAWLGWYPAVMLYLAFIGIELFGHTTPFSLSVALLAYTMLTVAMAWLFGIDTWSRQGEFFGVILGLVGRMAPAAYEPAGGGRVAVRWRRPLSGLLEDNAAHSSLALIILFMLASTAYDGAHETLPWSRSGGRSIRSWSRRSKRTARSRMPSRRRYTISGSG